jgi:putative oxidoreductase
MDQMFSKWQPAALSLLRFITGLLFLQYGVAKLFKFPPVPMFEKVQLFSLYGTAGAIELIGGILLVLGLFTRPVAFIASGEMAVAYFMSHAPRGFFPVLNHGDLAILFCFVFLYLACAGGGPYSLDAIVRKKS